MTIFFVVVPFNNSFKPGKKSFDFFVNQVSYLPERAKNVDFSASYYDVNQAIVATSVPPLSGPAWDDCTSWSASG